MKRWEQYRYGIAVVGLLLATACSSSSDSGGGSKSKYEYTENGCSTGVHEFSSLEEYCTQISNDELNNHCAPMSRNYFFKERCESNAPAPNPNPPKPVPNPSPTPKSPDGLSCFDSSVVAPKGSEIALEKWVDGTPGVYRLTSLNGIILAKQGSLQQSAGAMATAATDENLKKPEVAGVITCKDFEVTPTGTMDGKFRSPILIKRETGALVGGVQSSFKLFGRNLISKDTVDTIRQDSFGIPSLQAVLAMRKPGEEYHFYRVNPTTVQVVSSIKVTSNGMTMESMTSAIYIFEPAVAASPAPAPVPAPQPAPPPPPPPPPSVSQQAADAVGAICNGFYSVNEQTSCLLNFKNSTPQLDVIPICDGFYSSSEKLTCLKALNGKTFAKGVAGICDEFYSSNEKLYCLKSLANGSFSESVVSTCNRNYGPTAKLSCLKQFMP